MLISLNIFNKAEIQAHDIFFNWHTKADHFYAKTNSQFTLYTFLFKFCFWVFLKDSLIVVSEIGQVVHTPAVRQLQNRSHLTPQQITCGCSDVGAV